MKIKKPIVLLLGVALTFFGTFICACTPKEEPQPTVYYSDFGAVGDGAHDDFNAIIATHEYANKNGCKVKADSEALYYIGAHTKTAKIKTDTDWGNAEFIVDDRGVSTENRSWNIFEVASDNETKKIDVPKGFSLTKGQTNVNLNLDEPALLYIVNSNKKDYIRYGKNQNGGSDRQEVILVDADGNVDESTPILWDYTEVTSITAYSVTDEAITVKGGIFTTHANVEPISSNYYARGISVKRSNTTLLSVDHYVVGEGEQSSPYTGFFHVSSSNNVTIKNCLLTGHTTYTNIKPTGAVSQGTYDTQAVRSNKVSWVGCKQSNGITDTTYWGVMASNFCKNLLMEDCKLSRFDAHQGVFNATIKNTVLGQNLTIIGAGTLLLENVERLSGNHFVELRADYGSTWEGDVIFKDCTLTTTESACYALQASWADWDFGYQCYLPQTVTINNLKVNGADKVYVYNSVTGTKADAVQASINPLIITKTVDIYNQTALIGLSSNSSGLFAGVEVINNY